jgi:RimJ/RimL family protein N-acetyltransferase
VTNEVLLREVLEADLTLFFEQQRQPAANRMAGFPAREHAAFMAHWARIMADETVVIRTIVFQGQVAGNIVSFLQDGRREVGYWIGQELWGQGIASRALKLFLHEETRRPLYAHVAIQNPASRRVLEKCGFQIIGEDQWANPGGERAEEYILKLE